MARRQVSCLRRCDQSEGLAGLLADYRASSACVSPEMYVSLSIYGGHQMATLQRPLAGFSADSAVDLSSKAVQQRLSRSAIAALFKLAQAWQLRDGSARQLLGGVSNGVFYQLK